MILILLFLGALPTWPHSRSWGYGPSGGLGLVVVVLLLVGITGLALYRGWFHLSTKSTDQKPNATITVDKDKIHADEETAKEKVQGLGQEAKERTVDLTEKVKQ